MALEIIGLTKRFGGFTALDAASFVVAPGTVHALLGENGAGKSTLVKCVAGTQRVEEGSFVVDEREQSIATPVAARALGIGMVWQHFTLAPNLSVAENLLLAGGRVPAAIDWRRERAALEAFMRGTPFRLSLDATPAQLAAGEKQKLELLKQLYLQPRLLILDEPTSVLTPQEADEVVGHVRGFAHAGHCSVILITHKFREVMAYADDVTVLRRGRVVHRAAVASCTPAELAAAMMGDAASAGPQTLDSESNRQRAKKSRSSVAIKSIANDSDDAVGASDPGDPHGAAGRLVVRDLVVQGDRGAAAVRGLSFEVAAGEILGIAGVSGNGQRELFEALVGQRPRVAGEVRVAGQPYLARRADNQRLHVRSLPEEPLKNACVAGLSVAANMALRDFDRPPLARGGRLRFDVWRTRAREWIDAYGIQTRGADAPIGSLSGGNVQRAVLARELAGRIDVLIAANPVFGLDFAAVAEIHVRLRRVRADGGAVLLISEDLDELLQLADRIAVMSEGRIVHETSAAGADRRAIGAHMGGGHGTAPVGPIAPVEPLVEESAS